MEDRLSDGLVMSVPKHTSSSRLQRGRRADRAAAAYVHAAKAAPHRPEFWAKAAAMLLRVEDLKLAAEMVERSLEQEPDNTAMIQLDIYDAAGMMQRCTHGAAYPSDRPGCG